MIGLMGAGKTAVGSAVARILGVPFRDSDQEIEAAANMTIAEIFERDGEAFFREKETQVLARLLAGPPCILSTGGGAYLRAENRALISEKGVAVWIKADLDLLWSRVRHKNTRPLLRTDNPRETLARLLAEREPAYSKAEIVVEAEPGLSVEEMARKVVRTLEKAPRAGLVREGA